MAGVNSDYTIQYNYSDASSEQISKNGQSGASYEDITKAVTNKFITSFTVTVSDWSGIDTIYWKYDDGLTSGIGPPTNLATTQNLHSGAVGVTWTAPTGYTNTPERYAVAFSDDNFETTNFAVATTTNSGDTAYTFSKQYLLSTFTDLAVGDTLYFKVRSDDDTNSLYSSWTDVVTYTIPDVASGVSTLTANQDNQYQGVIFYWTQPNTGWATQTSYKLAYKDSDDTEFTYVTGISADATNYTWTGVLEDTYEFLIYACTQNDSWCHGPQNGSITTTIVSTTPTTTIVYTLGPPMNPVVTQEYNVGVNVDWDEPNTGNATVDHYELYYRTSAENETKVDNITETEYTIPYNAIPNGEYTFSVRAISTTNSVNSGFSTEPTLTVFNQKAQDDADAAAEEERKRKEREEAERKERERQAELQRQRDKNLSETGYSETDQERSDREYAEEQARLAELQRQRDKNAAETGYSETDDERADREYKEELERLAELERQRNANQAETGYFETDVERADREAAELAAEKARIEEEIKNSVVVPIETETDEDGNVVEVELTEEEQEELEELVDAIIDIKNTVDFEEFEVEEEVIEIDIDLEDVVIVIEPVEEDEPKQDEADTSDSGFPIPEEKSEEELEDLSEDELEEYKEERKEVVEAYVEELEEEIIEEVLPETVSVEEFKEIKEKEVEELTEEEVAIVVEVATEVIEEVVDTEELTEVIESEDIVILEEEELEDLSEEELEAYEEEIEEVIEEFVEELETEELVVVVEQIAEVGVENLAVADEQTVKVVQAVVAEVVDTETVDELSEEEVEAVAEVLGFEEEEDVAIIAEIAAEEEAVAEAVSEYVERAVENADVENYTLADTVTEVQVELFLENPVGQLLDVKIDEITISEIGSDMTSDQKEKAQEVVVPVILASQIIANAGALIRRF